MSIDPTIDVPGAIAHFEDLRKRLQALHEATNRTVATLRLIDRWGLTPKGEERLAEALDAADAVSRQLCLKCREREAA